MFIYNEKKPLNTPMTIQDEDVIKIITFYTKVEKLKTNLNTEDFQNIKTRVKKPQHNHNYRM